MSSPPPTEAGPPRLSATAFAVCLGVTLAIFALLHPLWEPMDMEQMDANILWSYYPIPLLVAAALAHERKLGWAAWFLESLKLTLVKFAVTFLFANTMWAWFSPPPERPAAESMPGAEAPEAARFDPVEPPAQAADDGAPRDAAAVLRVLRADGEPAVGALVYVAAGLTGEWPRPTEALTLEVDVDGFTPPVLVARAFQPLTLRATDDELHATHGSRDGRNLFNYPALPGGERELMFDRGYGLVELRCRTHEESAVAHLLVLEHPFAGRTDVTGLVRFDGLPAGELEIAVWTEDGARGAVTLDVPRGGEASAELQLP